MGRLIDEDTLIDSIPDLSVFEQEDFGTPDMIHLIEDAPTVEAIPKADYENRLKADLVAMLTELQLEIEEIEIDCPFGSEPVSKTAAFYEGVSASSRLIQQRINDLRGEK